MDQMTIRVIYIGAAPAAVHPPERSGVLDRVSFNRRWCVLRFRGVDEERYSLCTGNRKTGVWKIPAEELERLKRSL